ncbi:MAG: energy transducer TonB [Burkholderiales bacterium]
MDFAQESKAGSRATAFLAVVGVHALLIGAIVSGLAQKVVEKVTGPIETKVIEEIKPPPPPPEKIVPPPPDLKAPPPPFVPIPEINISAPPPPNAVTTQSTQVPPPAEFKPAPPPVVNPPPAPVAAPPAKVSAGMLCPTRSNPEMPSVQFEGVGEYVVLGTVRGGKVVAVEIRVKRGVGDRRAERAIRSNIEAALSQYRCNTDGIFEQEFVFKLE